MMNESLNTETTLSTKKAMKDNSFESENSTSLDNISTLKQSNNNNDDEAQEHGKTELGHGGGEQCHADAVQCEQGHKNLGHDLAPAGPDTGIGFAVTCAHDLVQIGLGVGIYRGSGIGFFLE